MEDVVIQFDTVQVMVTTDFPEVADFVRASHGAMVVHEASEGAFRIAVTGDVEKIMLGDEDFEMRGRPVSSMFGLIKREIDAAFLRMSAHLLWLHSAAVARNGVALLLPAGSTQGKSTITKFLCDMGWQYLSDEMSPIRLTDGVVIPYPRSPVRRINISNQETARAEDLPTETWTVPVSTLARGPASVGAIAFPRFKFGARTELRRLTRSEALVELIRNTVNFDDHQQAAITGLAELVPANRCWSMEYGAGERAAEDLNLELKRLIPPVLERPQIFI